MTLSVLHTNTIYSITPWILIFLVSEAINFLKKEWLGLWCVVFFPLVKEGAKRHGILKMRLLGESFDIHSLVLKDEEFYTD